MNPITDRELARPVVRALLYEWVLLYLLVAAASSIVSRTVAWRYQSVLTRHAVKQVAIAVSRADSPWWFLVAFVLQ